MPQLRARLRKPCVAAAVSVSLRAETIRLLERLPSDEHLSFSRWGNLLVLRSHSPEVPETFPLYETNLRTVLRRHPQGAGMVLIVEHAEPPPHGYVERVQGLLNAYRAQVLAGCAILEARGFAAAVQRAAGTAILSMSRMRGRLAIHESVDSAVPWLMERLLPQAERLERGRELRALLAPSRTPSIP